MVYDSTPELCRYFFKQLKLTVYCDDGGCHDVKETAIIDLVNPSNECQPWANHPVGTYGASGGILDNSLLICGGNSYTLGSRTDKCFVIDQSNSNEGTQKLPTKSGYSGFTVINQTLFMTGGTDGKSI